MLWRYFHLSFQFCSIVSSQHLQCGLVKYTFYYLLHFGSFINSRVQNQLLPAAANWHLTLKIWSILVKIARVNHPIYFLVTLKFLFYNKFDLSLVIKTKLFQSIQDTAFKGETNKSHVIMSEWCVLESLFVKSLGQGLVSILYQIVQDSSEVLWSTQMGPLSPYSDLTKLEV